MNHEVKHLIVTWTRATFDKSTRPETSSFTKSAAHGDLGQKNAQIKWLLTVARFGGQKKHVFFVVGSKNWEENMYSTTVPFKNQHLFLNCVALKYCQNWRSEVLQTLWIELQSGMVLFSKFSSNKKRGLSDIASSSFFVVFLGVKQLHGTTSKRFSGDRKVPKFHPSGDFWVVCCQLSFPSMDSKDHQKVSAVFQIPSVKCLNQIPDSAAYAAQLHPRSLT